jgi:hypothetical protein
VGRESRIVEEFGALKEEGLSKMMDYTYYVERLTQASRGVVTRTLIVTEPRYIMERKGKERKKK